MSRRFTIAWLVVFIVWMAGSFLVHGVLLHDDYTALQAIFRSEKESQPLFPFMVLAHLMLSASLVWIYSRGVEAAAWMGQGLRFGFAVAFLTVIPTYLIYYVVQPMPPGTVAKQIVFDGVLMLVLGVVVAFMYRDGKRA